MGDEEPITKSDFNTLMTQMEAMMAEIQSHRTQLETLASGTSSTTPPTPVDPSDKPSLNEVDPKNVEVPEGDEDTNNKDKPPREQSLGIPPPVSYVSGRHLQMPHLASSVLRHHDTSQTYL
jgi:hypothetical protein